MGITAVHNYGTIKKLNSCLYFKKPKPKYTHTQTGTHTVVRVMDYLVMKLLRHSVGQ